MKTYVRIIEIHIKQSFAKFSIFIELILILMNQILRACVLDFSLDDNFNDVGWQKRFDRLVIWFVCSLPLWYSSLVLSEGGDTKEDALNIPIICYFCVDLSWSKELYIASDNMYYWPMKHTNLDTFSVIKLCDFLSVWVDFWW